MQFVHIHRFDEMLDKPGFFTIDEILWHSVAAQGNGQQLRVALAKFPQEFQTAPVGQTDIGNEEVIFLALAPFDRAPHILY